MIPDWRAFICLSPDKAEYPFNAIGITKAIGEKTFRDILFVSDSDFVSNRAGTLSRDSTLDALHPGSP